MELAPWPTHKNQHAHMRMRQQQNRGRDVKAEDWMADHLRTTGREWTRQAQWGFRLFDFWNRDLGIAVEVDGPSHDLEADTASDHSNLIRSGIVVLRVRNYNEHEAAKALAVIHTAEAWNVRRAAVGLKAIR